MKCIYCGARTSSRADNCGNCGSVIDADEIRAHAERSARARKERSRRMVSHAVLATLMAVAGGLWLMFGAAPRQGGVARAIAATMLLVGLIWYLYARVRLWLIQRN